MSSDVQDVSTRAQTSLFDLYRPNSGVDSVLDYYAHDSLRRHSSSSRSLPRAYSLGSQSEMSVESSKPAPILTSKYQPTMKESHFLNQNTNCGRPSSQAPVMRRNLSSKSFTSRESYEFAPTKQQTDVYGQSNIRYHNYSRIPVYEGQSEVLSAPGQATRQRFSQVRESIVIPEAENNHHDYAEERNNDQRHATTKAARDAQLPRSVSLPLKNLINSETPHRDTTSMLYASLPSRRGQLRSTEVRRSSSLSFPANRSDVRRSKTLREEQTKRLHAINNAPSGPPPWLDHFTPDSRLPADQQLIPTVARKIAHERWVSQHGAAQAPLSRTAETSDRSVGSMTEGSSKRAQASSSEAIELISHASVGPVDVSVMTNSPMLGQDPSNSSRSRSQNLSASVPNFSRRSTQMPPANEENEVLDAQSTTNRTPSVPTRTTGDCSSQAAAHTERRTVAEREPHEINDSSMSEKQNLKVQKKAACCIIM